LTYSWQEWTGKDSVSKEQAAFKQEHDAIHPQGITSVACTIDWDAPAGTLALRQASASI